MTKTLGKITTPIEVSPDLSKPSLEGLVWLLRHQEMWPEGFIWSYAGLGTCAFGLAVRTWGDVRDAELLGYGTVGLTLLDLPRPMSFAGRERNPLLAPFYSFPPNSTPEAVASAIERALMGSMDQTAIRRAVDALQQAADDIRDAEGSRDREAPSNLRVRQTLEVARMLQACSHVLERQFDESAHCSGKRT